MSAHGRKRSNGRAQLMLLRGGLDDFSGSARGGASTADEADWQLFCARIGWQEEPQDVGDDYADRLAEKIFGGAALRDNVIELAVEREVKAAKEAPVTRSALRRATARGALLAVAGMAAAAVVCFFGASVLSAAGGSARALPVDEGSVPAVAPAPQAQPLDSASVEPTATPADTASPKTKPPGSLVAQRSARHRARGRAVAPPVMASGQDHHAEVVQTALSAPVPLADMIDIRPGALQSFDGVVAVPDIASLTPRAVPADIHEVRGTELAMARSAPVSSSRERAASPSWGLTPASERWYGMGLAPTYEPSSMPAGMAVMAQVDVGKALKL
jgi:hypothetical protein